MITYKREQIKVNFNWEVYTFKNIPIMKYPDRNGIGNNEYYVRMGGVSKVIRQYVKQKYGVKVQMKTSSFSGGNSANVYIDPINVKSEQYELIKSDLEALFQYGTFNGMIDSYEYHNDAEYIKTWICKKSDDSCDYKMSDTKEIEFTTKYLFTDHAFKWGTKAYKDYDEVRSTQI